MFGTGVELGQVVKHRKNGYRLCPSDQLRLGRIMQRNFDKRVYHSRAQNLHRLQPELHLQRMTADDEDILHRVSQVRNKCRVSKIAHKVIIRLKFKAMNSNKRKQAERTVDEYRTQSPRNLTANILLNV